MSLIGLNIVFGIIVDTFAELRDERVTKLNSNLVVLTCNNFIQWRIEEDMKGCCFICNNANYEFERRAKVCIFLL